MGASLSEERFYEILEKKVFTRQMLYVKRQNPNDENDYSGIVVTRDRKIFSFTHSTYNSIETEKYLKDEAYDEIRAYIESTILNNEYEDNTYVDPKGYDVILDLNYYNEGQKTIINNEIVVDAEAHIYKYLRFNGGTKEDDKLEEQLEKTILGYTYWNGLHVPCHGGLLITLDKKIYSYTYYQYYNDGDSGIQETKELTDEEYHKVITFIKDNIIKKEFDYQPTTDVTRTIIVNYEGVRRKIQDNMKLSSAVYKFFEDLIKG